MTPFLEITDRNNGGKYDSIFLSPDCSEKSLKINVNRKVKFKNAGGWTIWTLLTLWKKDMEPWRSRVMNITHILLKNTGHSMEIRNEATENIESIQMTEKSSSLLIYQSNKYHIDKFDWKLWSICLHAVKAPIWIMCPSSNALRPKHNPTRIHWGGIDSKGKWTYQRQIKCWRKPSWSCSLWNWSPLRLIWGSYPFYASGWFTCLSFQSNQILVLCAKQRFLGHWVANVASC